MSDDKNGGPNYLKAWRGHAGLTQQELADRVHKSVSMINMLEAGERGLTLKWLRMLAPPLGISPGELADRDPEAAGADTPPPAWIPKEETLSRLMATALRALPGGHARSEHAQLLAHAISEALKMLAPETGREDDPGFLAALDRRIILVISSHNPPPSQSATHTQRHKSDKP